MDRIVKSLLNDFLSSLELLSEGTEKDFEKFANYSIISREYQRNFDLAHVVTGDGHDTGIDGIAIIVNGLLVESSDEIDSMIKNNNYLEADFIFVQSKISSSFDNQGMHGFGFGVQDFFAENPQLPRNDKVKEWAELSDYLFKNASYFRENPSCKLFYVTTGTWNEDDQNLQAVVSTTTKALETTNLFNRVTYSPFGASAISEAYRKTKSSLSASFVFADKVTLPELPDIAEAYLGVLPLSEFKKLLIDENGKLLDIFYDNVRDFQGQNIPVNKQIVSTLNGRMPELFTVLNNGVTIVAYDIKPAGNRFTIYDYQIVNGCQTSNILFPYIEREDLQTLNIPVKLVITNNDELKNQITVATNSQTGFKREQLQAMTEFQKNLEHYYNTIEGDGRMFYERRSGQYRSDSTVIKARIVDLRIQIKSFSAMFLKNPHLVTSFFGTLIKTQVENDEPNIFNPKHKFVPYYTAALAYYRLDTLFRSRSIDSKYRRAKFFLLMLFNLVASPYNLDSSHMNSEKKTEAYCQPLIDLLNDKEKTSSCFEKTIEIWDMANIDIDDKQALKQATTTQKLLNTYRKKFSTWVPT